MILQKCTKLMRNIWCMFKYKRLISRSTNEIQKSVFISQTHNIYANLALEEWIYRNYNFIDNHVLMLWSNNPCIVIGRHQNPWKEANISNLRKITEKGIQLARRCSGGGTVYHDRGNLNVTFFVDKHEYNRRQNLDLIVRAIFKWYGITIDVSPKEYLCVKNCKVSGSAARIGRPNAYHHCSLLVDVDKECLSEALKHRQFEMETTATRSIDSIICNLTDIKPEITVDGLISAITSEFIGNQSKSNYFLRKIIPIDEIFPGISKIRESFEDWEWCYGKTPKFTLQKKFIVPSHLLDRHTRANVKLGVELVVEKGRVQDVILNVPSNLSHTEFNREITMVSQIKGQKFSFHWELDKNQHDLNDCKDNFVTNCIWQILPNY